MATMRSEMQSPARNISNATHCQPGSQGKAQNSAASVRLTPAYQKRGSPRASRRPAGIVPSAMATVSALLMMASSRLLTCRCSPSSVPSTLFIPIVIPDNSVRPMKPARKRRASLPRPKAGDAG